jgi:acetoacetyl-CoA synthetase
MHTRRPILAIELHNLEVGPSVLESIEETAKAVVGRMREVQPVGPYAILGYSFGGNLAVEVARQLTANGQKVELVTVLDSYVPGLLPKGLSEVVMHLRIIAGLNLHESYTYISSRIKRRLFPRFQSSPKSKIERAIAEAAKHCLHAYDAHRPEGFSGRIVLVRATDFGDLMEAADPSGTCGWSFVCKGGVYVIPMPCRHEDFFKEPHVTDLAGHIDDLLDAIDE